jgi:hypothetical protein
MTDKKPVLLPPDLRLIPKLPPMPVACAFCWKPVEIHGKRHSLVGRFRRRRAST